MAAAPPKPYRDTLLLPRTTFPMRARPQQQEPALLERWQAMDLFARQRARAQGRPPFVLHDGPPYANGAIHMGTAFNKILKDMVGRAQSMLGRDANYVPGWDCHGLPIAWRVEETFRAQGEERTDMPPARFRAACRRFAARWRDVQRGQFQRLGVSADWQGAWSTMDSFAEATIVAEFHRLVMDGRIYRASRPVLWSCAERTALAEAEVEHQERVSPQVWVRFPLVAGAEAMRGADLLIWTTTPWTLPFNRLIAYAEKVSYGVWQVAEAESEALAKPGARLVLADARAEVLAAQAKLRLTRVADVVWQGARYAHPLRDMGLTETAPVVAADFVADDAGTGLVHIAPSHGPDDWALARRHGVEAQASIDPDGRYHAAAKVFAGAQALAASGPSEADTLVIQALRARGALLAQASVRHSYPHSWRSRTPLMYRATEQWFLRVDDDLRAKVMAAIDTVAWIPRSGKARMRAMIAARDDWVVSRQRAWGSPMALFARTGDREPLRDAKVNARIHQAMLREGIEGWFSAPSEAFLGDAYDPQEYHRVDDVLDVWFDSGASYAYVLEARDDLSAPADLYLEGVDQHRGWFNAALIESVATRGHAPYRAVLTHGFVLDGKGRKMSKSLGNVLDPQKVVDKLGADALRVWAASCDFTEDVTVADTTLDAAARSLARARNALRFMLGNLQGFDAQTEGVALDAMPALERWIHHRLAEVDASVRAAYAEHKFRQAYATLSRFAADDLSALYFDIRKDSLYCDDPTSARRRACRTTLDRVFSRLVAWFAPILSFTAEEAFLAYAGDTAHADSVHLHDFPETPPAWLDAALAQRWARLRAARRVAMGALEAARQQGLIGAGLDATLTLWRDDAADTDLGEALAETDLAELAIVSQARVLVAAAPADAFRLAEVPGVAVQVAGAQGKRCARSWKVLPDVGADADFPDLSLRDARAVRAARAAADPADPAGSAGSAGSAGV